MTEENSTKEQTLLKVNPAMFRAHPIWFIICLIIPLLWPILIIWWLSSKAKTLTITSKRSTVNRGLLSKHTTEVWHRDIRNLQIHQGILQRVLGVGTIAISSAGQGDIEIAFEGIKAPESVKQLIDQYR